ncbi:PLP-dependent aminotransferase family protein [Okibacterium endophyticum]
MVEVHITARALASLLGHWRDNGPAYRSLADRIRLLVLDGRVPADTRLPAERDLAERLNVSRTTVTAAYRELRESDYLVSTRGSGSVARLPGTRPADASFREHGYLDFSKAALPPAPQVPDAARVAAERLPRYLVGHDYDGTGITELREAIADRYTDAGLETSPDELMVTLGAQHAIALISRTFLRRGDPVLIEQPTYPHAFDALRSAGARPVPVPVTADEGWPADEIEQVIETTRPSLAYVMPDFHNPTGASMADETRGRLCRSAAGHNTTLVVDETTADLDIDRGTLPPFGAGDTAGARIVRVGSVGKTVWGGLRIGWIRADPSTIRTLVAARMQSDLGTPVLEQLTVLHLLPQLDEILALRRRQLRATRDRLCSLLDESHPSWKAARVSGGLAAWVSLGAPVSSQLALAARNQGLLIAAGPRFGIDGAFERFIRIPITYGIDETERAVTALDAAWRSIVRMPMPDDGSLSAVI